MPFLVRKRKWILFACGALLAYALLGFVVIPFVITSVVLPDVSDQLGRSVAAQDVQFNPFVLSLNVRGFEIQESDHSPLLGFDELFVNFQLSSIFRQAYTFDEIRLTMPFAVVKVEPSGDLNLASLVPAASPADTDSRPAQAPESAKDDEAPPAIDIALLSIERGILEFHDESRPTPFEAHVVPIDVALENFTTRKDESHSQTVSADLPGGGTLSWDGTLSVQPLRSEGRLALTGFPFRAPWEYIQDQVGFEIADGSLTFTTGYQVTLGDAVHVKLSESEVKVADFVLKEKGGTEDLIALASLEIRGVDLDVPHRRLVLESVHSGGARVRGWRREDGTINYQTLFAVRPQATGPPASTEVPPRPETESATWTALVKEVTIEDSAVAFEDRTPAGPVPVNLDAIKVHLTNLTSPPTEPVGLKLQFNLNETGTVTVAGMIGLEPVTANLDVHVSDLAGKPFQPYLGQIVPKLQLVRGAANLKGRVRYLAQPVREPKLRYEGSASVTGLALVDGEYREDVFTWDALSFDGLLLEVEPTSIAIAEILYTRPAQHVSVRPDGTVNLLSILKGFREVSAQGAAPAGDGAARHTKPAEPIPVKIDSLKIVDGAVTFVDRSLQPHVATGLHRINGEVKGVSSDPGRTARVRMEGAVDNSGPLLIRGEIQPLAREQHANVAVTLKHVDLTNESPYLMKFTGYPIKKGKLSLDLLYKLSGQSVEAQNTIVLDQFTLGEHVESPEAMSLPLPLALALLKDRAGRIDVDLPLRGDLNDPEFSYGGVVLTALRNLITKAATAPFAALGNLLGGDAEDLEFVAFSPGSTEVPSDQASKLDALAKALDARPGLSLEVTGMAHGDRDRLALAERKLGTQLRMARMEEQRALKQPLLDEVDAVVLSPEEELRLLKLLYTRKFGPEPGRPPAAEVQVGETGVLTSPAGQAGQGPSPEAMREALVESIPVEESELRLLGQTRASQIRDHLVQGGHVPAERIFLLNAEVVDPSKVDEANGDSVRSHLTLSAH